LQWTGSVLVVDDDEDICKVVKIALEAEGFQVDMAYDGKTGLDLVYCKVYDVIILDIMLPVLDGWEVCRRIRKGSDPGIPIIMLTAKTDESDRILGLKIGADDYVIKPFSPRELAFRAKALIRRTKKYNKDKVIRTADLTIDVGGHRVLLDEKEIELSPKEFELLALLIEYPGQIFSREDVLRHIWRYDFLGNSRTVDEHIKRLRQKLGTGKYQYIQTVWGVGYKFEVKQK
jgi:DNA-binding response OmpR family regulator